MGSIREKFGKTVRKRRKELGMTQEELCFSAELHRAYIGGVERGERNNVTLETLEKLAAALKTEPYKLLM